jgi:tetratricopeptide (TPR) repeat protein
LNFCSRHIKFWYKFIETRWCEKALESLKKAIDINPENIDAYNYKAIILYDLERYEESKKCLEESLNHSEANTLGQIYLGKILLNLGDIVGAEEKLKIAIKKVENRDTRSLTQCLQGLICFKNGEYDEAERSFDRAISLDPLDRKYVILKNYVRYLHLEHSSGSLEVKKENRKTSDLDKNPTCG